MLQQIYESTINFQNRVSKIQRKGKGQFFTPLSVAKYMASFSTNSMQYIRILDCGAGTGILAATLCDKLLENELVHTVVLDLYENDNVVLPILRQNIQIMIETFREAGKQLNVNIIEDNFILYNQELWNSKELEGEYDIIIANPPYKKLTKSAPESKAMLDIVHGQPNIYFLFMAMSSKLLRENGEMIFITPRSFTSGAYFKAFREDFLNTISIKHIHVFNSRTRVFDGEQVLQEAIIIKAIKDINKRDVIKITTSNDMDFEHGENFQVDYNIIVDMENNNKYILIPSSLEDIKILRIVTKWQNNLIDLGFKIKTGPVVDFRAKEWIREFPDNITVPLLYPEHYKDNKIKFPINTNKKFQYIKNIDKTRNIMLDNKNYLLIKRFTAKEESRRLQCAIYFAENYNQYNQIGIENHNNYLAKLNGNITYEELYGMFCLFNSSILDKYYRIMNGNTQVNATETNSIPLPDLNVICELGSELMKRENITTKECDNIIKRIIY
ncbi:hypothetical protein FC976_00305 [Clostridium sporogenes]|uniref:Eco57I restriction-modification methylase domain-containing protein n=1 Tax=Clostridium sporogenes TaxID=1509 RepID=UPI0013D2842E|nr:Eco57I restriction-modification methylase domain-containing protein [Clostridium sporogenes]NFH45693.1 hypothetical protein [Clostridium sporogenes]